MKYDLAKSQFYRLSSLYLSNEAFIAKAAEIEKKAILYSALMRLAFSKSCYEFLQNSVKKEKGYCLSVTTYTVPLRLISLRTPF